MIKNLFEKTRNAHGRSFVVYPLVMGLLLSLGGCAGLSASSGIQPQVTSLVVSGRLEDAADKLAGEKANYGRGNDLLYYLDRGLIELMAGRYKASTESFEKAKARFQELYTVSVTDETFSWLTNDYALPYRGSDHEYVLVNIFQALNFVELGQIDEALVEARDLDAKYQVIEEIAKNSKRARFADNGFARFLMGILYEFRGGEQDLNGAFLFYKQSMALYEGYYSGSYMPQILRENAAALAEKYNDQAMLAKLKGVSHFTLADKKKKAEIYLVEFVGYSPVKETEMIPIPVGKDLIVALAFPKLVMRGHVTRRSILSASPAAGIEQSSDSILGADIEDIARRDLDAKRALVLSKAVLRPALKAIIERKQKENIEKSYGPLAGGIFGMLASVYNLYTERADLRSWKALPAQVRIARLLLDPGQYQIKLKDMTAEGVQARSKEIGLFDLKAGDKKIIVYRALP